MTPAAYAESPLALTREEVFAEVVRIAAEQVGADPAILNAATHFVNDLGYDSLDTVEFIMSIEERFELAIPDESAEVVRTVGAALELVQTLRAAGGK